MTGEELLILKLLGGFLSLVAGLTVVIYKVWVARIQKDKDRLVELRHDADGSKQLTIKGYSQEDQAKIVRQLTRNTIVDFPATRNGNGRASMSRILKS